MEITVKQMYQIEENGHQMGFPRQLMMENAGAQCLLLAGFFADQMRVRHNVRWYAVLGAGFYRRAAERARSPKTAHVMSAMADHFEPWRQRHVRLSRELRDQPYLLDRN